MAPIQPWMQKGNRGIGFSKKATVNSQPVSRVDDAETVAKRSKASAEQAVGEKRSKLVAKIVEDELSGEGFDAKIRRHKQIMKQEEEDARGRQIARSLSRAWNDPFDVPGGHGDSNPLGRKHRLSALNPLLDDD